MTSNDIAERTTSDATGTTSYVTFLRAEFPEWDFEIGETDTWSGESRELWIARQDGHHPQSELTAAKLHTRLSNYLEREGRRHGAAN